MKPERVYVVDEKSIYDREFVLNFLEDHYYRSEPLLSKYLEMHSHLIKPRTLEMIMADLRRRYRPMVERCRLLVIGRQSSSAANIGVALAVLEKRSRQRSVAPWDDVPLRTAFVDYFLNYVQLPAEKRIDFFDLFPDVKTIMRITVIGVREENRLNGIGTNMLKQLLMRAKKKVVGVDLVCGLFTEPHLRRVAERIGFRCYAEMQIENFHDPLGNNIYVGLEPHTVALLAIKLK